MHSLLSKLFLVTTIVHGGLLDVRRKRAIPVDFFVFLGTDGEDENVAPRTSMNIEPPDNATGFHIVCKDRCPVFSENCGPACTSPQMRWCRCIAETLVQDLNSDFGALLAGDSDPIFTLGSYHELSSGQDFFNVRDGHSTLYSLMDAEGSLYSRQSGHVTVWVANHVGTADDPQSMLAGTTFLDQPLWRSGRGAGVLFHAQTDRSSKILSHEVGHVVGFHHTAGPSMLHKYEHLECPKEYQHVETHPLIFPTCEMNIMGYWYDGPYCCPGESASFLQGISRRKQCLPHSLTNYQEAHCCGHECMHVCPKTLPVATFVTKEHKEPLAKILKCWLYLQGVPEPKSSTALIGMKNVTNHASGMIECFDYGKQLGLCRSEVRG